MIFPSCPSLIIDPIAQVHHSLNSLFTDDTVCEKYNKSVEIWPLCARFGNGRLKKKRKCSNNCVLACPNGSTSLSEGCIERSRVNRSKMTRIVRKVLKLVVRVVFWTKYLDRKNAPDQRLKTGEARRDPRSHKMKNVALKFVFNVPINPS